MKTIIRSILRKTLGFNRDSAFPAGHYYSPIVSTSNIKKRVSEIWAESSPLNINGIDLNSNEQINLVKGFSKFYSELPFSPTKDNLHRYFFENGFYSYTDGIILYSMIRHFEPKRIIEIGSGFSSAVMLDTKEIFFNNNIDLTFIEPYPDRLNSLIKESDKKQTKIIQSEIQKVSLDLFKELNEGDILFVDSTHVVKTGSDVNFILFEILPILKSGVLIHFHDIFYPFEYPQKWVVEGRNWNEDYFLKAFLMYNDHFKILLFADYLHKNHKEAFSELPLTYKNSGGNLWIQKK